MFDSTERLVMHMAFLALVIRGSELVQKARRSCPWYSGRAQEKAAWVTSSTESTYLFQYGGTSSLKDDILYLRSMYS